MPDPEQASTQMNMRARLLPPPVEYLSGPTIRGTYFTASYWGTDFIMIAVTAVMMSIVIGLPIGVISGYFGAASTMCSCGSSTRLRVFLYCFWH